MLLSEPMATTNSQTDHALSQSQIPLTLTSKTKLETIVLPKIETSELQSSMDWWTQALNEHSPLQIALVKWVPVLITVVIGGLFASIIFPRWQDRYIAKKKYH